MAMIFSFKLHASLAWGRSMQYLTAFHIIANQNQGQKSR